MKIIRALARYWFILPVLVLVVGLQLGASAIGARTFNDEQDDLAVQALGGASARSRGLPPVHLATSLPTLTPTSMPRSTATRRPTSAPIPTKTPVPTDTPATPPTTTPTPPPAVTPTQTSTFTPEPTPVGDNISLTVPILMYHYISAPPSDADAVRRDLSVPPDLFEAHLAYLRQAGYETISMHELSYALSRNAPLPAKPIILTFDDGYRDQYENAFPLLRQYGYTGTFFIFTQVIDTYNVSYLTWDMVIEMHQAGMEFGSHSYRHPDLSGRDVDFLVYEILGSKEAIEERIGEPVRFFSYPSGRYDDLTIKVLDSAHFWSAVTTQFGAEQSYNDRFELKRIRIRGNDTIDDLAAKLNLFQGPQTEQQ